jgi:dipeptidyl aminopeptidase/acylaminoacyl peptidase
MVKRRTKKPRSFWLRLRHRLQLSLIVFLLVYLGLSIYGANLFTSNAYRYLGWESPDEYHIAYENITFPSADPDRVKLKGWWIPHAGSGRALVLVHGRTMNRADLMELGERLWNRGFNLLLFDLRGHGESDGDHHSFGQHEQWDVIGAVNLVRDKGFAPDSIGVLGWSMGAASAILAFARTPDIQAVVSDSSYANFNELVRSEFTPLTGLPEFFLPGMMMAGQMLWNIDIDQASPEKVIGHLAGRHVFLIHGEWDRIVPLSEAYRLKEAGGSAVADLWVAPESGHTRSYFWHSDDYVRRVVTFFDRELSG